MHLRLFLHSLSLAFILCAFASPVAAQPALTWEAALRELKPDVFAPEDRARLSGMLGAHLRSRLAEANARSRADWLAITNRLQWETFTRSRLEKLRASLGAPATPAAKLNVRTAGEIAGEGCRIRRLVFETRPGLWATANLYLPVRDRERGMPGLLICHSHHRPKEHSELQDMGMTWARAGCAVLVMDQLGHGERRQHPFASAKDFAGDFRVSRQDYHYRYDTGIQLSLLGESLAGWMAWDMSRGVDLLLSLPGIAADQIILLGSVAGGGDPTAVAAALDTRIACVVPFNFGGPQPETRFPLPADIETSFNYAGSGSWESTRNLRLSARDGFLPWVIVGSIAPRRLIYAHEFGWHRERDPVWQRLETIQGFFQTPDRLAFTHGRGELKGSPPEASHCTHIGQPHRERIHTAFAKWFGIQAEEFSKPVPEDQLRCWTPALTQAAQPKRLVDVLPDWAQRLRDARGTSRSGNPAVHARLLRNRLAPLLGEVVPAAKAKVLRHDNATAATGLRVEKVVLQTEAGIEVPLLLLSRKTDAPRQAVAVALAQEGKAGFLQHRAAHIAILLEAGVMVCLPDVRGTGETRAGSERGPESSDAAHSATAWMLGDTMPGARLRDTRAVLAWLRSREDVDAKRIALWGESFVAVNVSNVKYPTPRRVEGQPRVSDPASPLLALLTALYEEDVRAVYTHGGLADFASVLKHQQVLIPSDAVIPGLLAAGDLPELVRLVALRPLKQTSTVNALNQRVDPASKEPVSEAGPWLVEQLKLTKP
ncbi:MAG: hypothetical protein EXS22_01220 [Pedosphaera sp.]|nr:hypothetical protein [Pedosphaera sp.]MSU42646.1 hypothetical protein [Pedosphaera sp.]